jgi:hypothetical protein
MINFIGYYLFTKTEYIDWISNQLMRQRKEDEENHNPKKQNN